MLAKILSSNAASTEALYYFAHGFILTRTVEPCVSSDQCYEFGGLGSDCCHGHE